MREPRRWIWVLWIWWGASLLFLLGLWWLTFQHSIASLLAERQLAADLQIRDLSHTLTYLPKLQAELLENLRASAYKGDLTPTQFQRVRQQAEPYCRVYWVNPAPPPWMTALVRPRIPLGQPVTGQVVLIRPFPPGLEAGRLSAQDAVPPAGTPENYFLLCAPGPDDTLLISAVDLEYMSGPWLQQQTARFSLPVQARWLDSEEPASAPAPADSSSQWRWLLHPLLADDSHPFGALEITVDNRPELAANRRNYLLILGGGAMVFCSFAASLYLAGLGVRREMEFAEARTRFTQMVSHELRTPVAAIKMYAEILENQLVEDPEKVAGYHRTIGGEADRLERMVESLLEVGALERGQRAFKMDPLDLNELARKARPVELLLQEHLPLAMADRQATLQILDNLIHNAEKYGSPPITLITRSDPRGVVVEIRDHGPGIPTAQQARIFEPYHRLASDAGARPGVGLGLAIVQGYMHGQGGTVTVTNHPQGGAVFTCYFKLAQS